VEVEAAPFNSGKGGKFVHCDVIDVSFGGLSVNIDRELIVGSILSLSAELPSMEKPFYLVGKVMWCRPVDNEKNTGWTAGFYLITAHDSDIASWKELLESV
jgi:Tfp pilus assembly protein PilZ